MAAIRYYNKMAAGDELNYLYVFAPKQTLLIGWMEMYNGPEVFTKIKLKGNTKRPRGYKKISGNLAAEILLADILDSQTSMPYR